MEIVSDCIFSSESYEKFGLSEQRRISNERVESFFNRGLMTQVAVHERYTKLLSQALLNGSPDGKASRDIQQAFDQLSDSQAEGITRHKFIPVVAKRLADLEQYASDAGVGCLFDILEWHSAYPFPINSSASKTQAISSQAFFRAICRLTGRTPNSLIPRSSGAVHRVHSGEWGPHEGWLVATRGKDADDIRRWLFRCLAERNSSTVTTSPTTINVPRFIMLQERQEDSPAHSEEPEQEIVISALEKEQDIDLQDVLSECAPGEALTASPLRESYGIILHSLPSHVDDLAHLHVRKDRLSSLLEILRPFEPLDGSPASEELASLTAYVTQFEGVYIDWTDFAGFSTKHIDHITRLLQRAFGLLGTPSDEI